MAENRGVLKLKYNKYIFIIFCIVYFVIDSRKNNIISLKVNYYYGSRGN